MKKIIVTGGAGFIGTNLIERLLKEDNFVLCIDNLQTGRECNVKKFENNPHYKFIQTDITNNVPYLTSLIKEGFGFKYDTFSIDEIYNLACPASPPKYQANPLHTLRTSIAIDNMCMIALLYGAKILHSSTSEIYGDPIVHPQAEDYRGNVNTIGPRSCYDEGKRVAETFLYEYKKLGVDTKIIRIFNTYGPYMDPTDGRVVSNFICQALKGEPITIYGDGSQTRSFQYIDDLIDGMIKVMESVEFGPFNIGNPVEFTVKELAEMVKEMVNDVNVTYHNLPTDDPIQRKPVIKQMKEKFGWEPKTQLSEGLEKTIEYFKEELKKGE